MFTLLDYKAWDPVESVRTQVVDTSFQTHHISVAKKKAFQFFQYCYFSRVWLLIL